MAGPGGLVGVGLTTDSVLGLVTTVVLVDISLLLVLLGVSAWFLREGAPTPEEPAPAIV